VAQPRAKATSIGGHARVYDPGTAAPWRQVIGMMARQAMGQAAPWTGAVRCDVTFFMPIPKSMRVRDRARAEAEDLPHTCKPDKDNLEKAVLDALRGVLWADDCQVFDGRVRKVYSPRPRVEIAAVEVEGRR
jgi:Holliday junction resolvase RusA-like endonuclease